MRIVLLPSLLLCLFIGCSKNNPIGVDATSRINVSIIWKKNNTAIVPEDVNSVRITLRSDLLSSDRVNDFSFQSGTGNIEELPSGIDLSVTVDGLDTNGRMLYTGNTRLASLPSGETAIKVTSNYIILPDRQGPVIQVLSHKNNDTVNTRVVRIFGQAIDSSGIGLLKIDTMATPCQNFFWDYHGYRLTEGRNVITLIAIDGSPGNNETRKTLILNCLPGYQMIANHAPSFLVTPGYLTATLKAGQTYSRSLIAADPDEFNTLFFRMSAPLQLTSDTFIQWTTSMVDTGVHAVYALVFDQDSAKDSIAWIIRVVDSSINLPPFFLTRPQALTRDVYVGNPYLDTVLAADREQESGLRYRLINGPEGAGVDSLTGIVTWVPQNDDVGIVWLNVRVDDDAGLTASLFWSVTVRHPTVLKFSAGRDTAVSINDSVYLCPQIDVSSGGIVKYEWDIGNTGRFLSGSKADTGFIAPGTAVDTLVCILRITITNGDMIEDRVVIRVLQDLPWASAGKDSIVGPHQEVHITGLAQDKFGIITKMEWDLGNTGDFKTYGLFDDVFFIMPGTVQSYSCVFRVTDDDNNVVQDIVTFRIPKKDMVLIRPDTFSMGVSNGIADEAPSHPILLSPFYIDSTEVTQKEFLEILGVQPSSYGYQMNDPIESVTWYDAALYCNALSKLSGFDTVYRYTRIEGIPGNNCTFLQNLKIHYSVLGYRLPTEAEWEYACRGATTTDYYWGTETGIAPQYAVFGGGVNSSPFPVARKKPNAFGLYDMAGNVWEWCNDWYGPYSVDSLLNPKGPVSGSARVIRGGSWQDNVLELKSTNRSIGSPGWKSNFVGFRTVLQTRE